MTTTAFLPGLFDAPARADFFAGMDPERSIRVVARLMLSHFTEIGLNDKRMQRDPRYKVAVAQAVSLSLWVDERYPRRAWANSADLSRRLRERGNGGITGKIAKAAMILGRAVLDDDKPGLIAQATDLMIEASLLHAARKGLPVDQARADLQFGIMAAAQSRTFI